MADLVLGVAKSLVEGTLTKAQSAIEEEAKLRQSTQRDLVFIAEEFQMMRSFLSATTEENVKNKVVSTWVFQVRDLAYDVEDCIEFVINLDKKTEWWCRMIPSCMAPARPLDGAVEIIEQLKARVQDVSQRRARYNRTSDSGSNPVLEAKQPASAGAYLEMLQGRDNAWKQRDLEALTRLITKKVSDLQVISVWASGGDLGEESVIRKVYDDPKIWEFFPCRAWVKLAHPLNLDEFFRSVLDQFYANSAEEKQGAGHGTDVLMKKKKKTASEGEDFHLVQELFMQHVNNNTYLIVIEDVSSRVKWNAIQKYIPDRKNGSRVLVSTQQFEIASFCTGLPYFQRFSADHSLCVFSKQDFQTDANEVTNRVILTEEVLHFKKKVTLALMDHFPLVGREPEMCELPNFPSMATVKALQVISVWGVAGVGKSSLVRNLYHNRLSHKLFHKFGWVDVSHPLNLKDFCRNLLLEFYYHSDEANEATFCGNMGIRDPIEECRNILKHHTCLLIIDDLETTEEWDLIQAALISRPSKSIILVITNEEKIALYCADGKDLVFNVKSLQTDASFDLFKKEVQRKNRMFPIESIDRDADLRQLVLKCGGLPNVIVATADYLAPWTYHWPGVAKSLNARFMQDLETKPEFACLRSLFGWMHSYFRACPDFLRPCIFYLSIFPGYSSIRRRRLVMRWVAEGFSKDNDSYTAEENGEDLFSKLVEMSMVQPPMEAINTNMRMVSCNVSPFFYEYIISRPEKENVVFALEIFALKNFCRPTSQRTGRHLVIDQSWQRDRIVFDRIDFSKLRSLTVFGEWVPFLISKGMKVLRVLDLENAKGLTDKDLEQMVKLLRRLKFLSIRGSSQIFHLPHSMGDLKQLETLDVRDTSIASLPASITNLNKLQYVRAGTTNTLVPRSLIPWLPGCCKSRRFVGVEVTRGTDKLTALHTLGVVDVGVIGGRAILKDLSKLSHLRKLGLSGVTKKIGKVFCSTISGNARLESLSVWLRKGSSYCLDGISTPPHNLQSLKLYGLVGKLPDWIKLAEKLKKVDLEITIPSEIDISGVLGDLKELCILRLSVKLLKDSELTLCVTNQNKAEERSYAMVKIFEITCCSKTVSLLNITFGSIAMKNLELLKAGCRSIRSQLRFNGLNHLSKIKDVHVIEDHDGTLKKHLEDQFAGHANQPYFNRFSSHHISTVRSSPPELQSLQ